VTVRMPTVGWCRCGMQPACSRAAPCLRRTHLGGRAGQEASARQHHASHGGQAGDGIGHRHEGGVQRGGHTPEDGEGKR